MKKMISKHLFTLLLILVSCLSAIILNVKSDIKKEEFVKVSVSTGDTIWKLADQYANEYNLSKKQFVNWVIVHNDLSDKQIYPGEELLLPIKEMQLGDNRELASSVGE